MPLGAVIRRLCGCGSKQAAHLELGKRGEKLAVKFLRRKQGYKILLRNFQSKHGEIDVVCRDKDTLVFVEVKTRTTEDFGQPAEAVDKEKRLHLSRAALDYLRRLGNPDIHFRFDIVEVVMNNDNAMEMHLIRNAFQLSEPFRY